MLDHHNSCSGSCTFDTKDDYLETCDECGDSVRRCRFFLDFLGDAGGYCETCQDKKEKELA